MRAQGCHFGGFGRHFGIICEIKIESKSTSQKTSRFSSIFDPFGCPRAAVFAIFSETETKTNSTKKYIFLKVHDSLSNLAAETISKAVKEYIEGKLPIEKQNNVEVTYADKIEKHETKINWSLAANEIRNLIYSISPSPGAWTMTKEKKRLKILSASIQEIEGEEGVLLKNQFVGCGLKSLKITEVQPEGKRAMPFEDYLRGKNFSVSERIFD